MWSEANWDTTHSDGWWFSSTKGEDWQNYDLCGYNGFLTSDQATLAGPNWNQLFGVPSL
ncbi:MAG TPA: hypothetical protein VGP46_02865 [Acidimicrobiales bacterium]|jgi:hypothetical protein|nr:hypothetical protein [Acidimicrobiales bacterium]